MQNRKYSKKQHKTNKNNHDHINIHVRPEGRIKRAVFAETHTLYSFTPSKRVLHTELVVWTLPGSK